MVAPGHWGRLVPDERHDLRPDLGLNVVVPILSQETGHPSDLALELPPDLRRQPPAPAAARPRRRAQAGLRGEARAPPAD